MTIDDIPLPAMPVPPPREPLWGLAFSGEYVVPVSTRRIAEINQEMCDEMDAKMRAKGGDHLHNAKVIEWPGSAEAHARGLEDEEFALPLDGRAVQS